METTGIFGLAYLMRHSSASLKCILANIAARSLTAESRKSIDNLIRYVLRFSEELNLQSSTNE